MFPSTSFRVTRNPPVRLILATLFDVAVSDRVLMQPLSTPQRDGCGRDAYDVSTSHKRPCFLVGRRWSAGSGILSGLYSADAGPCQTSRGKIII